MKSTTALVLTAMAALGCSTTTEAPEPATEAPQTEAAEVAVVKEASLPAFTIIENETMQSFKRSVTVRLEEPVDEEDVERLAREIKAQDPKAYERTFILYYLPDQTPGQEAAWATSHFDPELNVHILGLSAEQMAEMEKVEPADDRKVIGKWLVQYMSARAEVYEKDGKTFMLTTYSDGSAGDSEMRVEKTSKGTKLVETDGRQDEYYLVDNAGNLQAYDEMGVIFTAKPL